MIIVILSLMLLTSCDDTTDYHFDVVYLNGDKETVVVRARNSFVRPVLVHSCIAWYDSESDILCGVSRFTWYKTKPTKNPTD